MHLVSSKRNERICHISNLRLSLIFWDAYMVTPPPDLIMRATKMDTIWRGSFPSLYHQWDALENIAITSPLLTRLTFWLESSSSSSSSSHDLFDLHPECPRNKELPLKVSRHLAKTIPNFTSPVQIYLCYVETIIKWFFCDHVKYINMHSLNSRKETISGASKYWGIEMVLLSIVFFVEGNNYAF